LKSKRKKPAPVISVFGTGSDVGKSIVTTAICRYFYNHGIHVAPFKAQNMSNNSGVTPEGLEMGRAQIVQAEAAGIPPHVDMNPILLKPTSQTGAQVVLLGKVFTTSTAVEYHGKKEHLFTEAKMALNRLRDEYDLIIMEGAGSCAEVNLMPHDIVNLPMAEYAGSSVILVADINKGGVFAQILGTLSCISETQKALIKGFIINKFRGDSRLFHDGVSWIEEKTTRPVFGVLPWYDHILIEAEDSVAIESVPKGLKNRSGKPVVAVIRLPHIANFNDVDPLSRVKDIDLRFLDRPEDLTMASAVIIPGSKNTIEDLLWLRHTQFHTALTAYANNGGHILGICGGFQMLGEIVHDPEGLESDKESIKGLGLLPVHTTLKAPKTTSLTWVEWQGEKGLGYEIHMGHTGNKGGEPVFQVTKRNETPLKDVDGCATDHGRIMGTYLHGLFDSPGILKKWLGQIGLPEADVPETGGLEARNREYDLLAKHFETFVDMEKIEDMMGL